MEYDDERVNIIYKAMPKDKDKRGANGRAVGAIAGEVQFGNDSDTLQSAIEGKALRYGQLNAPFLLCINKQSIGLDKIEINEALYGKLAISWSDNPANRAERAEYMGDGAFGSSHNPKLTRLSGVYITNWNSANLATTAEHVLKTNFWAKHPLLSDLQTINHASIKDLLNIPDGYPFP